MPPSIGAPATMREVEYSGNAWVQAPFSLSFRMPSQTSGPENISLPLTSKQLSTALAGRFCAMVRVGVARQRMIQKMGNSDNLVIWFTDTMPGVPKASQSLEAIVVMEVDGQLSLIHI